MNGNKQLARVTDLQYHTFKREVIVRLYARTADGERRVTNVTGTRPYAFVPLTGRDHERQALTQNYVLDIEGGYEGYDGQPLKRVTVERPQNVNDLKEEYPEGALYESDIPYERRVAADYGLAGYVRLPPGDQVPVEEIETDIDAADVQTIEPRAILADIETVPPDNSRDFEKFTSRADKPITAITCYDTYTDEYVCFVLDPEGSVDGGGIRDILREQWAGHENEQRHTEADLTLVRTENEQGLLDRFIGYVESTQADVISGWNWIDFDHRYILNRLDRFDESEIDKSRLSPEGWVGDGNYKAAEAIDGLPAFDMMESFTEKMTFSKWKSARLDYVANSEIGVGKLGDVSVGEEYEEDRTRFVAYNILDTQLLTALDEKHGIFDFFYQVSDLCSVRIVDTMSELRMVDGFVLARRGDDEILPIQDDSDLDEIAGGLVLSPSMGIDEWVAVLDLKSLYPSVFITYNISEETMTKDPGEADLVCPGMPESEDDVGGTIAERHIDWDVSDEAMGLSTEEEGILPKYLKLLFDERARMKSIRDEYDPNSAEYQVYDNKQGAIKVLMNSFFGVSQNQYYRLSNTIGDTDQNVGSSITGGARYVTWRGSQMAEEMGYDVLYGDTDSIMIQLAGPGEDVTPEEVVDRGMEIEERINDRMDEVADEIGVDETHPYLEGADLHGNDRHTLSWEFEKLYRRFLQAGKKKRYAGLPVWKEGKWIADPDAEDIDVEPDIVGFESNRADMPIIAADIQETMVKHVLADVPFDLVSSYLAEKTGDIQQMRVEPWKVARPGSLNQPIHEYGDIPVPRACRYSNEFLGYGWREGDDPWVYPIKKTPPMKAGTDVVALEWGEELPEGFEVDRREIIEKRVKKPLEPILSVTEWTFEELETGNRVERIDVGSGGETPFEGVNGSDAPSNPFVSGGRGEGDTGDSEAAGDTENVDSGDDGTERIDDPLSF